MEAYYCFIENFDQGVSSASLRYIEVATFEGPYFELANQSGRPSTWLSRYRTERSYWKKDVSHPIAYYSSYDPNNRQSTQSCSAYRDAEIEGAVLNFKYDIPYSMRTGYKVYDSAKSRFPIAQGNGNGIEILFEGATNLVVTAIAGLAMTVSI